MYEHIILIDDTMRLHASPIPEEDGAQTTLVDEVTRSATKIEMMRIDPRPTVSIWHASLLFQAKYWRTWMSFSMILFLYYVIPDFL